MQPNDRKDLGYLGEDFQKRLVRIFFIDNNFFKDLASVIDQNMFTNPFLRCVVGLMKDHFNKYEVVPSFATLEAALNNTVRSSLDREQYIAWLEELKTLDIDSVDYIKDLSGKFFKQQNIVKVANTILKIAEKGDDNQYEQCVGLLQDALSVGMQDDLGNTVFDELAATLSDDYRITIPTGIGKLDEALEGGIGKGELGLIIGSSGFGKTSITTSISAHAATFKSKDNNYQGFKVLQIVFEDRIKQIQRKHIGKITGVEAKDLSKQENIAKVRELLDTYEDKDMLFNNLRIVRFPSGEITANGIKRYIKKLINTGFKPDLVIVDYFECLEHEKDSNTSNEYEREGKTMRRFESMACELDMGMWITSQGSRDSINMEIVTMDKVSGSIKKAQIAHIIISIARTIEDMANNKAVLSLLKNRAGKSGSVWNGVDFNNGTCRISTDNVDEYGSSIAFDEAQKKNDIDEIREYKKNKLKR